MLTLLSTGQAGLTKGTSSISRQVLKVAGTCASGATVVYLPEAMSHEEFNTTLFIQLEGTPVRNFIYELMVDDNSLDAL